MKNKKDLFDLFRESEHKLEERPSNDAWRKLERKLDTRQTRHTTTIYRQLAMVAAVIALVAIISVISLLVEKQNDQFAAANDTQAPYHLEDLEVYTDASNTPYKIVEFQRAHHSRISNPTIQEGSRNQRLVAVNTIYQETSSTTLLADNKGYQKTASDNNTSITTADVDVSKPIAMLEKEAKVISPSAPPVITKTTSPVSNTDKIIEKDIVAYEESGFEDTEDVVMDEAIVITSTEIEPPAAKPTTTVKPEREPDFGQEDVTQAYTHTANSRRTEAQIRNESNTSSGGIQYEQDIIEAKEATDDNIQYASKAKKKSRVTKDETYDASLNAASNAIIVGANTPQPGLTKFQWLIGQWKGNSPSGSSFEDWKMVNDFTIQGKGFIVVNGDTTFTEGMRIQRLGSDLYYILALDESKQAVKFKLKTYVEQQAIFENETLAFPNQVIIRKNANNSYTTILQNKAPTQIQEEQLNYINQRNVIRNEQAIRNLERVMKN